MKPQEINLFWHNYKFFPYEKKFAVREVQSLLQPTGLKELDDKLIIFGLNNSKGIEKLVYFSHAQIEKNIFPTLQFHFENGSGKVVRHKRQNTRYSVHGLHEYKGKFNPQVVRSLFNIHKIKEGDKVLDPFCGSGTTLVEAAHDNVYCFGTDINPLAVFIANAKIDALNVSYKDILQGEVNFFANFKKERKTIILPSNDLRVEYLKKWFSLDTLKDIEALRLSAEVLDDRIRNIFLVIISNNLRDYSLQEPSDLRIRRRSSPFPNISLIEQLSISIKYFANNIKEFQSSFKKINSSNKAFNIDIKNSNQLQEFGQDETFDFAITSPPYATALPYIDTQRLSLIWLNFISPNQIKPLECDLTGSREYKIKADQLYWNKSLLSNHHNLPDEVRAFCLMLYKQMKSGDGFRKQAVPSLLYRYFYDMGLAFENVYRLLKKEKYFCLIVGHNHTTIGGTKTDIDTPKLLTYIGEKVGFKTHEVMPLDAYHRYGINSLNAVQKESLIVFKK